MAWKGFTEESKRYWGNPTGWRAVRFWLFYPKAWFRFFVLIPLRQRFALWRYRRRNGNAEQ